MKAVIFFCCLLMLTACGSSGQKDVVENPYAERMKELTHNGVSAMQRERWLVAEKLFDRALHAAQLANDSNLIARAWYNLGVLYASKGDNEKAVAALKKTMRVAEQHQLEVTHLRAKTALALLRQKQGHAAWRPDAFSASMPMDLHLSLARLAQLQKRYNVARREYAFVLKKKVSDRASVLYQIEAHMGMALLADQQADEVAVKQSVHQVLEMSRKVGAPRLAAHALLLSAKWEKNLISKDDSLQDALVIYQRLQDVRGQKDVLAQLIIVAEKQSDQMRLKALQEQLHTLEIE